MKGIVAALGRLFAIALLFWAGSAQALWLSVYGAGGYDTVTSRPDPSVASEGFSSPNPSGLSYGLGVSVEPMRLSKGLLGLAIGGGLSGFSTSWQSEVRNVVPFGVEVDSIGAGLNSALNLHFSGARVYLYGDFHYGFSNSYVQVLDGGSTPVLNNTVHSIMRLTGGIGAGYTFAGITVAAQGGAANYIIDLTSPVTDDNPNPKRVTDSYQDWLGVVQLVVAYDIISGDKKAKVKEKKKKKKRKGKKKRSKSKRKKRSKSKKRR